jgi:hypothetical protein
MNSSSCCSFKYINRKKTLNSKHGTQSVLPAKTASKAIASANPADEVAAGTYSQSGRAHQGGN